MPRPRLDQIDRHILRDLQADGRMTNVDLAKRVGISAPPCLRRIKNLEEAGVIRGYHAEINPEAVGYSVTVFALVQLDSQTEADLRRFEEMVADWPLVRECDMLAGEFDFLLKVISRGWEDYQDFLTNQLEVAPNVANVKSTLAIRQAKWAPGVPLDEGLEAPPPGAEEEEEMESPSGRSETVVEDAEAAGAGSQSSAGDEPVAEEEAPKPVRRRGRKKTAAA